jgi:hypothetical protein
MLDFALAKEAGWRKVETLFFSFFALYDTLRYLPVFGHIQGIS